MVTITGLLVDFRSSCLTLGAMRLFGLVLTGALVISVAIAEPARAYQPYTSAYMFGYTYPYNNVSGVYAVRTDLPITTRGSGPGCQVPSGAGAYPVYQAQWILLVGTPQTWMELGTGHQCGNAHYWYWGYGWNGQWTLQGYAWGITTNRTAYMDLHRVANYWYRKINGATVVGDPYYWNAIGQYAEVGVESYDSGALIPAHIISQIQMTRSDGSWTTFNFMYKHQDTPGPCGVVLDVTDLEAWQDASCP